MSLFDIDVLPVTPAPTGRLEVVAFTAHGMPKPQGSKRAFIAGGRAVMTESNKGGHRDWRATVSSCALDAMGDRPMVEGPLAVVMTFAMPRPKSHPKGRRTWPQQRPDVDKLVRAVADSCTHIVWKDDSQVVELTARKVWAEIDVPHGAGVDITVHLITDAAGA